MKKVLFIYKEQQIIQLVPEYLFVIDNLIELLSRRTLDIEEDEEIFMNAAGFLNNELIKIGNELFKKQFTSIEGLNNSFLVDVDMVYKLIV